MQNQAPQVNANADGAANGQQQQPQKPKFGIFQMIMIYWVMNWVMSNFFGNKTKGANPQLFSNAFDNNEPFEFKMYLTNQSVADWDWDWDQDEPIWEEKNLHYNYDTSNYREKEISLELDELLRLGAENRTLYAHFFLHSLRDHDSVNYTQISHLLHLNSSIRLIEYKKKKEVKEADNLLFGGEETKPKKQIDIIEEKKIVIAPHLKPKVWINLIHDENQYHPSQVPPQIPLSLDFEQRMYPPIIDTSNWWLREKEYILLDDTVENKTLNVTFFFNTYWIYKFIMEKQMSQANGLYEEYGVDTNMDDIKEMFMDTNPYLLAVTIVVSLLHSVFEFLALKNDISFWKSLESHRGLSLRSLYVNLYVELIVLLYLFDNETSTLILVSSVAEMGVTIWKILRTTKLRRRADGKFPWFELNHKDTYTSTTEVHDQKAMKYLMWVLLPLYIGYTIYSLIYDEHKGWYSFFIQTQVGFIYVFGFIQMTPQLYINYKLKSVEHLPWRTLVYKFLNTIVDDLFAFVITMPWLKRLSCFRDDIIFLIYLYQRRIYRIDKTRDAHGNVITREVVPVQNTDSVVQESSANKNAKKKKE